MIYKIGEYYIDWKDTNFPLVNDQFYDQFLVNEIKDNNKIISIKTKYLDLESIVKDYEVINYTSSSEFYQTDKGLLVIYHWARCRFAIGFYLDDLDQEEVIIYFNKKMDEQIPITANWFFSICGLHHILLKKNMPILHASYIEYNNKAILFAAPSGVGKSTQASLWKEYKDATIVNDDRVLIGCNNENWYAYGYPSTGSSKICLNRTNEIACIVLLQQSNQNKIQELTISEKVKSLILGIEIFTWDENELNMSIDIATLIASQVKIIKLECLPDQSAVHLLNDYLEGVMK